MKALSARAKKFLKNKDALAQCVFVSRLLGANPTLVLHGGGNTSVKIQNAASEELIYVKGTGTSLARARRADFACLKRAPLLAARRRDTISDTEMYALFACHSHDKKSPRPSIETLSHVFIPERFILHTHPDAVLALTHQPDGAAMVRAALGSRVSVTPYAALGLALAQANMRAYESDPDTEGIVVLNHGIFTFGDTAELAYEKTRALVNRARAYINAHTTGSRTMESRALARRASQCVRVARKVLAAAGWKGVLSRMDNAVTRRFFRHPDAADLCQRGAVSPDHIPRTGVQPMWVSRAETPAAFRDKCEAALEAYRRRDEIYFRAQCENRGLRAPARQILPRVIFVPGVGVLAAAQTAARARVTLDIVFHTLTVMLDAEAIGTYVGISESDAFEIECR